MDTLINLLNSMGPLHWLVLGLILLIVEMASGTTYLLWPAVAAFITAVVALLFPTNWIAEMALFAVLIIVLTYFGHPLVKRWRNEGAATGLNERNLTMIGKRGVVANFANGVGSVKIADTIWRAVSEEALEAGQSVEVASVDGVTLKVKRV
ncbi:MAG TPA: NfeD family protein [Vitreimonas sp.]|nr:NfeD family protein [Vitreimonas sp.]